MHFLESVAYIQVEVECVGIVIFGVLREEIGLLLAYLRVGTEGVVVVVAVLLVATGTQVGVVADVLQLQVDAHRRTVLEAKRLADRCIEHPTAVVLLLLGTKRTHDVAILVEDNATILLQMLTEGIALLVG